MDRNDRLSNEEQDHYLRRADAVQRILGAENLANDIRRLVQLVDHWQRIAQKKDEAIQLLQFSHGIPHPTAADAPERGSQA